MVVARKEVVAIQVQNFNGDRATNDACRDDTRPSDWRRLSNIHESSWQQVFNIPELEHD
jgi:hypothetical protein